MYICESPDASVYCTLKLSDGFSFCEMHGRLHGRQYVPCSMLCLARKDRNMRFALLALGNFSGQISTWLTGFIVLRTGHFALAFIAAAIVSALGIVGWVGMVPKLVPLKWRTPVPPALPQEA